MSKLINDEFKNDPRILQAKKLLAQTLSEYQDKITAVKPCDPQFQDIYQQCIDLLGKRRGRPLYFPYLASGIGNGPLVELADGSVKYDFITGIGVHYMGHSHPKILEACIDAVLEDTVMQGNLQQNIKSIELSDRLVSSACANGADLKHVFLTTSGAMANENAFKIIFNRHAPASRLLAFERCFTGRSLSTAQMTNKPEYREGMPEVLKIDYVPFFDEKDPAVSTEKAVKTLSSLIEKYPGEYAGMTFELIQGEGGYYPGEQNFFVTLMEVLKKNKIAVMIDEIQTFGRTRELFAFQTFKLDSYVDVVTIGKMTQVCATLFSPDYNPKAAILSQTFTGSTTAIYACLATLDEIQNGGYLGPAGKIEQLSNYFRVKLQNIAEKFSKKLKGPFGMGAMIGMTVFDGDLETTKIFIQELYEAGVLCFLAGKNPYRVRFLMPMAGVSKEDIDHVSRIISAVIEKLNKD
ncbi:MAG: aminotransferase class III-fold pyridoxal phosphate-dependent enzyme [Candidatus Omnitrophica bacterium]|nr:aminotransferase class III-fold pyridoxal phosphate-dependent enzyme [Candidatus Omnitrophota bacterium]